MHVCDEVLSMINEAARTPQEFNYLRAYIGLKSSGVVKNFIHMSPKPTKKIVHIWFSHPNAEEWKDRFEEAGLPVTTRWKGHFRVTVTQGDFQEHKELIKEAIVETVKEADA